jgi:uncharacterized membrane protein YphA (DoxX/SURF4 family)
VDGLGILRPDLVRQWIEQQQAKPAKPALDSPTPPALKQRLNERFAVLVKFYGLDEKQKALAENVRKGAEEKIDFFFKDPDFQAQVLDYQDLLDQITLQERKLHTTDFEKERLADMYKRKAKNKGALTAKVEGPVKDLSNALVNSKDLLTADQAAKMPPKFDVSPTWKIDWANMIALTAVGVCLILGLFTRLACLGAAGLLLMYYSSMPPLPGLPDNPATEGHYLIINKNLIELVAVLMLATTRVGRWGGLDAFLCRRRAVKG